MSNVLARFAASELCVDWRGKRLFYRPSRIETLCQSSVVNANRISPFGQSACLLVPCKVSPMWTFCAFISAALLLQQSMACAASSASFVPVSVRVVVRMASGTVRDGGAPRSNGVATEIIDAACNGFKMGRVAARTISAQMVNFKSAWDWTYEFLISESVRCDSGVSCASGVAKVSVAAFPVDRTKPHPAWSEFRLTFWDWPILIDLGHESLQRRNNSFHNVHCIWKAGQ